MSQVSSKQLLRVAVLFECKSDFVAHPFTSFTSSKTVALLHSFKNVLDEGEHAVSVVERLPLLAIRGVNLHQ